METLRSPSRGTSLQHPEEKRSRFHSGTGGLPLLRPVAGSALRPRAPCGYIYHSSVAGRLSD